MLHLSALRPSARRIFIISKHEKIRLNCDKSGCSTSKFRQAHRSHNDTDVLHLYLDMKDDKKEWTCLPQKKIYLNKLIWSKIRFRTSYKLQVWSNMADCHSQQWANQKTALLILMRVGGGVYNGLSGSRKHGWNLHGEFKRGEFRELQ